MGDRILFVNGVDIRGASHQDAVLALLSKKDSMKMKVQHDPLPSGFRVRYFSMTPCGYRITNKTILFHVFFYNFQLFDAGG